jgi:hypothetical protein
MLATTTTLQLHRPTVSRVFCIVVVAAAVVGCSATAASDLSPL